MAYLQLYNMALEMVNGLHLYNTFFNLSSSKALFTVSHLPILSLTHSHTHGSREMERNKNKIRLNAAHFRSKRLNDVSLALVYYGNTFKLM